MGRVRIGGEGQGAGAEQSLPYINIVVVLLSLLFGASQTRVQYVPSFQAHIANDLTRATYSDGIYTFSCVNMLTNKTLFREKVHTSENQNGGVWATTDSQANLKYNTGKHGSTFSNGRNFYPVQDGYLGFLTKSRMHGNYTFLVRIHPERRDKDANQTLGSIRIICDLDRPSQILANRGSQLRGAVFGVLPDGKREHHVILFDLKNSKVVPGSRSPALKNLRMIDFDPFARWGIFLGKYGGRTGRVLQIDIHGKVLADITPARINLDDYAILDGEIVRWEDFKLYVFRKGSWQYIGPYVYMARTMDGLHVGLRQGSSYMIMPVKDLLHGRS